MELVGSRAAAVEDMAVSWNLKVEEDTEAAVEAVQGLDSVFVGDSNHWYSEGGALSDDGGLEAMAVVL